MKMLNVDIEVIRGSACDIGGDILVNAANTKMRSGGGIDGEIHRRCGEELMIELIEKAPNGAKTSEPIVTHTYGELDNYKNIIHIAGPIWDGTEQTSKCKQLRKCYQSCIEIAINMNAHSIVFPSISTGVYNFPLNLAAEIAIDKIIDSVIMLSVFDQWTINANPIPLNHIIFAMYGENEYNVFSNELKRIEQKRNVKEIAK